MLRNDFHKAGIQYMLTGSFALDYYAQPRMTRDMDFVVALTANDADSVVALFEGDYYVPTGTVHQRRLLAGTQVYYLDWFNGKRAKPPPPDLSEP